MNSSQKKVVQYLNEARPGQRPLPGPHRNGSAAIAFTQDIPAAGGVLLDISLGRHQRLRSFGSNHYR